MKDFLTNHPIVGGAIVVLWLVMMVKGLLAGPEKRRKARRKAAQPHAQAVIKPKPGVATPEKVVRPQNFGRNDKNGQAVTLQADPAVPGRVPKVLPPRDTTGDLLDPVPPLNVKLAPVYEEPAAEKTPERRSRKDKARKRQE